MNIKEAKIQIQNAMTAYFTKDEFGNYVIPVEKQRPVFLMGAPGIGKTAIMEQIAAELGVGLVSYSMTHHTRQSALGLPYIVKKNYNGKEYEVSEYTMSEIIASVYDMMEETGKKEGILFLDEINCVSETLAPSMLQFLQYKIFGRHTVPNGWIVVTAGNPPEYNNSVREFDIVTWDRLKRIDVSPDYQVWREFANNAGVHASILTYLDIHRDHFYKIESTIDGKTFVTARGWSDLSDMIKLYEKNNLPVKESLVSQYVQNREISKQFAVYYDLYNKYRSDYQIEDILSDKGVEHLVERAKKAKFDERIALVGLIFDAVSFKAKDIFMLSKVSEVFTGDMQQNKANLLRMTPVDAFTKASSEKAELLANEKKASSISKDMIYVYNSLISVYDKLVEELVKNNSTSSNVAVVLKKFFEEKRAELTEKAKDVGEALANSIHFLEKAFGDGNEMSIYLTELTINRYTASFISRYGCAAYAKHSKTLRLSERHDDINREIEVLDFDAFWNS